MIDLNYKPKKQREEQQKELPVIAEALLLLPFVIVFYMILTAA